MYFADGPQDYRDSTDSPRMRLQAQHHRVHTSHFSIFQIHLFGLLGENVMFTSVLGLVLTDLESADNANAALAQHGQFKTLKY